MKEFSKATILDDWDYWVNEDPNKDMNNGGYSVCICDVNNNTFADYNYAAVECSERIFKTKEEAWLHYYDDIFEYGITGRDFWGDIWWDDNCVVTVHYDEGGNSKVWIEKWEGFDDDIQIYWEYNGKKYKSLKDLWDAEPKFNGCYMETDRPWIRHEDDLAGEDMAELEIELSESFKKSCEDKEKELEEKKEARKKRIEEHRKKMEEAAKQKGFAIDEGLPF